MRTPSRLELNYREIANHIYRMIAEGNFPVKDNVYLAEAAPRVGDGLVRLNVAGEVLFASPNARSAFNRIGWDKDLEGQNFGQVLFDRDSEFFQKVDKVLTEGMVNEDMRYMVHPYTDVYALRGK